jgi:hypothetical protein
MIRGVGKWSLVAMQPRSKLSVPRPNKYYDSFFKTCKRTTMIIVRAEGCLPSELTMEEENNFERKKRRLLPSIRMI